LLYYLSVRVENHQIIGVTDHRRRVPLAGKRPFDALLQPVQSNVGQQGGAQSSYNIAKRLLEFVVTIPREHLRAGYGQGFRGAPLPSDTEAGRSPQGRPGGHRGTTRTTPKKTPRGPREI